MSRNTALQLPVVEGFNVASPLSARLQGLRKELRALDEQASARHCELKNFDRILKTTISLCPECLTHVGALVYSLDGRVLMRKRCPQHGLSDAVLENDENFYHLSNKDHWGRQGSRQRPRSPTLITISPRVP